MCAVVHVLGSVSSCLHPFFFIFGPPSYVFCYVHCQLHLFSFVKFHLSCSPFSLSCVIVHGVLYLLSCHLCESVNLGEDCIEQNTSCKKIMALQLNVAKQTKMFSLLPTLVCSVCFYFNA